MKTPTIHGYYPQAILAALDKAEHDTSLALRSAGISHSVLTNGSSRITVAQYSALYRYGLFALSDEMFGYLPRPLSPGGFEMAWELMLNSGNLEAALQRFTQFCRVAMDGVSVELLVNEQEAMFTVKLAEPNLDPWHFVPDTMLGSIYRLCIWLSGKNIVLKRAEFCYGAPPHAGEYHFLFPCSHKFGAKDRSAIILERDALQWPIIRRLSELRRLSKETPSCFLGALPGHQAVANKVYNELVSCPQPNILGCHRIAKKLNMSEQTLRRKLKTEGTSFQEIKDNLRRDVAIYHLSRGKRKISDIGDRLGFSTPGTFSRAFKQWVGVSPEQFRETEILLRR